MRYRPFRLGRADMQAAIKSPDRADKLAQLGVRDILIGLEALSVLHRTFHWRARGDNFFQQHLLFERLYTAIPEQIDKVAEHLVGLELPGDSAVTMSITAVRLSKAVADLLEQWPSGTTFVDQAHAAETAFLARLRYTRGALQSLNRLSAGLDNLLSGIAEEHDAGVYLLSRSRV